jgi:hypothetical protein
MSSWSVLLCLCVVSFILEVRGVHWKVLNPQSIHAEISAVQQVFYENGDFVLFGDSVYTRFVFSFGNSRIAYKALMP